MSYKKLIDKFRITADRWEQGEQLLLTGELRLQDAMRDAADAIETLLAERNALLGREKSEKGICKCCKYKGCLASSENCFKCLNGEDKWEWHGSSDEWSNA